MFLGIFMSLYSLAQETQNQKEVGIVFRNLDDFGLTFRTGTNRSLWRFSTLLASGSNFEETTDSIENKQSGRGFGIGFGREYRESISDKIELRFGADLTFSYRYSKVDFDNNSSVDRERFTERTTYHPGINLVFGLNYLINNLVIGAELLPNFSYITGTSVERDSRSNDGLERKTDISGFNYGLSNSSALLSLAYRF